MPDQSFNMMGERRLDIFRLRPGFFGVTLEQKVQTSDGEIYWDKCRRPLELSDKTLLILSRD